MHSLARRLLLSVSLALVLFFGLTVLALDALFRNLAQRSLRELLDAQVVALISAAEPDAEGRIASAAANFEGRLQTPGSGLYAEIRARDGQSIWRSPSLAGTFIEFDSRVAPGEQLFDYVTQRDGQRLAVARRGISWESGRAPQQLVFAVASDMQAYTRQLLRFRQQLLGGFLALALLLLATISGVLRWVMRPMRRLESELSQVEAGRREALGEGYPRELAGVARNLNRLIESERRRIARYRDTLGNLAHSLKTPLAVIRTSTAASQVVAAEVDRMSGIIEHQLQRAASGGAIIGQSPVDVLPVLQELRRTLGRVYAHKDLLIELAVPADLQFIGDRADLTESLGNLMDNACKWCATRVKVGATADADVAGGPRLMLTVEDDGPGIAAQQRARVLERGVRADESRPGHGLGLAMVRDMAELYGGRLTADASALGGAKLTLELPGRRRG